MKTANLGLYDSKHCTLCSGVTGADLCHGLQRHRGGFSWEFTSSMELYEELAIVKEAIL